MSYIVVSYPTIHNGCVTEGFTSKDTFNSLDEAIDFAVTCWCEIAIVEENNNKMLYHKPNP